MSAALSITAWPSLTVPHGSSTDTTIYDVLQWFRKPKVATDKASLPGFSLARFTGDQRALQSVETVSAVVLDDDSGKVDVEATAHRWASFAGVVFSTFSTTPDAPRSRIVLWTTRDMTAAEYPAVWRYVRTLAATRGVVLDEAPKDASRFWYVPVMRPDGVFVYAELGGEPLDVDAILAAAPAAERRAETSRSGDVQSTGADVSGAERHRRRRLYAAYLAAAPPCIEGQGGDRQLFRVVQYGAHDLALPAADVLELVADVYDVRCLPPWGHELEARVLHKVASAKTTSMRPAMPPLPEDLAFLLAGGSYEAVPENPTMDTAAQPRARLRLSPADRARKVGGKGLRLTTGLPSVDAATRGGLLLRKLCAIGGAPGAGKTALAVQLAFRWLVIGVYVAFLAADEDADALLIRFGQLAGLSRDALENGDPDERAKLAAWCESVPLILADGDEDETLEQVSRDLRDAAAGRPSVLFVDSIQTARTAEVPANGSDTRARVNVVVRALKHAAKVDGHLVIATSEISKAAYRNKAQAENVNALSAFKESGDIEYGVSLALVLTSRQGTSELVDVVVAKNRLGPGKPELMLKLDHARAAVTETSAEDARATDPLYFVKIEIRDVLSEMCGAPMMRTTIYNRIGGRKEKVVQAINEMLEKRQLFQDPRGVRFLLPGDPGYQASN